MRSTHLVLATAIVLAPLLSIRPAPALPEVAVSLPAARPPGTARSAPEPGPPHDDRTPVAYRPPVEAPVVDPFRPPVGPYGPGNRGIDYATEPGTVVRAAAAGTVVFAGAVAGSLHVTVLHADGLRTSYSFLATVGVATGDAVDGSSPVGTTLDRLHFGVRAGDEYLDPEALLSGAVRTTVHLVPHDPEGPGPTGGEADALLPVVAQRVASIAVGWPGSGWPGRVGEFLAALPTTLPPATDALSHLRTEATGIPRSVRLVAAVGRWLGRRDRCTPPDAPASRPGGRRIVVLVGGLGSTSRSAGVDRVDTSALGYREGDVVRFSYLGGKVPGTGAALGPIAAHPYGAADTGTDLEVSGRRLATLLHDVAAAAPGVPVDVVAHSQGGLVARLALAVLDGEAALGSGPGQVPVALVATLASPHGGADLATAVAAVGSTEAGARALDLVGGVLPADPGAPAVRQLSETSELVADLGRWGVPPGVHVLSVAARGDMVVPSGRSLLAGADHVVLPVDGPAAHDDLPGAPATTRELSLALAGLPPTCEELSDALVDAVAGESISGAEDALALTAATIVATGT